MRFAPYFFTAFVLLCTPLSAYADAVASPAAPAPDEAPTENLDVVPQAEEVAWHGEGFPVLERIIDQNTARTVRPQTFNSIINHRNFEGILKAPFAHLLGFDAGVLKIGLGLRYGILEHWDVAVYRQNFATDPFSTWEFDTRYQLLTQEEHFVDLALRAGFTWFEAQQSGVAQGFGGFGEVIVSHLFIDRLLFNLAFQFHSHSNGYEKSLYTNPTAYSGAILLGLEARILEWFAWDVEVDVSVVGYRQAYPIIVTGPKFITNKHSFALVVSNSQYSSADSIVSNTQNMDANTWVFGFNITREIGI